MADALLDLLNGGAQQPVSGDPLLQLVGSAQPMVAGNPASTLRVDPTQGNSFADNALAGAGKFVSDTGMGAKQLLNDLAAGAQNALKDTSVGRGIDQLNSRLGLQSPQAIQQQGRSDIAETRSLDAPLMKTGGGNVGYAGAALATIPLTPAVSGYGGAAALGTAMGLTQPATSWSERGKNTMLGAGSSVLGQAVGNGLSRVIQPQTAPAARDLMDAGITLTPGQILGGGFKRAEEGLTSVPVVGDFIKAAQNRQLSQLNQAVANRALAPIGQSVPQGTAVGRDLVDAVQQKLSNAYDNILPNISARVDPQFAGDLNNLSRLVANGNMAAPEVNQFNSILRNQVTSKLQGNGATGQTLKAMVSDLEGTASSLSRDPSFAQRQLGDAVGELASSVRGMMTRQNPAYAPQLSAIDQGYATFKRMQRSAASVGADNGIFNPAQLQNAVKALDRSKDKGAFARGDALLQDLSDPAKQLLSPKLNDSGTPYRSLLMAAAAGMAGHFVSPWAAIPALAAPAAYSPLGMKAMQGLLTARPNFAQPMAQAAGLLAIPGMYAAPALTYAAQQ